MYKIKRFSILKEIMYSKSLSEIRKRAGDYESSIAAHLLMFLANDEISSYWIHEITRFISDKIKNLDKKFIKNFSYRLLFPYYLGGDSSLKSTTIRLARKKIEEDNDVSVRYSSRYLDTSLLIEILERFSNELDNLKASLSRTIDLSKDEDEMEKILINLYNEYHNSIKK